jgi:hypothetical protein
MEINGMRYEYDNANKLNSIEITLAMGCKLDCRYCPQKLLLHNYFKDNVKRSSLMSFDDFKIILNRVKRGGTICFSGMCEPFLNPECGDMILYAYEQGFRIQLFTTLIGLNRENLEKLKGVEFDAITLHIPDEEGNSKFCLTDEYFEIVKLFQENIQISSYSCHGNIHPAVGDLVNPTIECRYTMMNRAGNLEEGLKSSPQGEIVCMVAPEGNYGNWTPEVLPDGTLLLCCMDYGMKHVLGNLIDMEVKEILEGQEYQRVQKGMQNTESDILCRKCSGDRDRKYPCL